MASADCGTITLPVLALEYVADMVKGIFCLPGQPLERNMRVTLPVSDSTGEAAFWQGLCHHATGVAPDVILAAKENLPGGIGELPFAAALSSAAEGIPLESLYNLLTVAGDTGISRVCDPLSAAIGGFLALPSLAKRQTNEGVLLIIASQGMLRATLVYQFRLYGCLELPLRTADLAKHLDSFRLGWLPPEVARQWGGNSLLCPSLPPAAEGFRPAFIAGENTLDLAAVGKVASIYGDSLMFGCWGLLARFGAMQGR